MHEHDEVKGESSLISTRSMEIVTALFLLAAGGVVITDSIRLGFGWQEGEGPAAGYFPFYIALTLCAASLVNLVRAVVGKDPDLGGSFVSRVAFSRVLAVLVPAICYVAAIHWLGLYVSSGLFIVFFMLMVGGESIVRAIPVGVVVPLFFFVMFEKWFLVPLPKGPLEAMLGY